MARHNTSTRQVEQATHVIDANLTCGPHSGNASTSSAEPSAPSTCLVAKPQQSKLRKENSRKAAAASAIEENKITTVTSVKLAMTMYQGQCD